MADDIASFGFDVDSAPLTKGALALKDMSSAADEATKSSKNLASTQGTLTTATQQNAAAFQKLTTENQKLRVANDNLVAANDNVRKSFGQTYETLEENKKSFIETAGHVLGLANQFKFLLGAAYLAVPALRGIVNSGIVGTISLLGPAATSAAGAIISRLGPAFSFIARWSVPILAVVAAFESMVSAFQVGAEKIESWSKLARDAFSAGVGTAFFQQMTKAADAFNVSASTTLEMLKKFEEASAPTLGGSSIEKRIDELTKAGNFEGNIGVEAFKGAKDTEERFRAIVTLVNEAIQKGERLAAIDLLSKFMPSELIARFRANNALLDEWVAKAAKINPIVSEKEIETAEVLKKRMKDARDIMSDELLPLNRDMAAQGLVIQENWIKLNEWMAIAVVKANQLYKWFLEIGTLIGKFGEASFWEKLNDFIKRNNLNFTLPGAMTAEEFNKRNNDTAKETTETEALAVAKIKLAKGLTEVALAQRKINEAQKDTSKDPDKDKNNALDRVYNQTIARTKAQEAETEVVGRSVAEMEKARVTALLKAAAERSDADALKISGLSEEERNKKIEEAAEAAGKAKSAFEQKTAVDKANFDVTAAGLNELEKSIAQVQYRLHGNEWKEYMKDVVAVNMRTADAINSQKQIIDSLKQQANAMQINVAVMGMATGAATAYRAAEQAIFEQELKSGRMSETRKQQIRDQAQALGELAQKEAEINAKRDADFNLQTVFMTDLEKSIAQVQKALHGDLWSQFMNDGLAATMRITDALKTLKDLTTSFVTDFAGEFRTQLRQGVDAWEAFHKAGISALTRLSDKLMDMALQNLVAKAFGGATGSGGILSFLMPTQSAPLIYGPGYDKGGTVGMGGGNPHWVDPRYFIGAPHFDKGGMINGDGVPIIAHKNERILNAQETREYNRRDNRPVEFHVHVDVTGANGDQAVWEIAQKAAAQGAVAVLKKVPGIAVSSVAKTRSNSPAFLRS